MQQIKIVSQIGEEVTKTIVKEVEEMQKYNYSIQGIVNHVSEKFNCAVSTHFAKDTTYISIF